MELLTLQLALFYGLQGWVLSFAGMAVLLQTKLIAGNDPAYASGLQAVYVISWYLKPLYGLALDACEKRHARVAARPVVCTCACACVPLTWCYFGSAMSTVASIWLAIVSVHLRDSGSGSSAGEAPSPTSYLLVYVFAMALSSTGTAIEDVVMDGLQVRWVHLVDAQSREGAGGGVQSATWRFRFLLSAVAGVAGAVCNEWLGSVVVHAMQALVHGFFLPVLLYSIQRTPSYKTLRDMACGSNVIELSPLTRDSLDEELELALATTDSDDNAHVEQSAMATSDTNTEDVTTSDLAATDDNSATCRVLSREAVSEPCSEDNARARVLAQVGKQEAIDNESHTMHRRAKLAYLRMLLFMFCFHVSPSVGGVWSYYLLENVQVRQSTLSLVGAVSGIALALGAWLYDVRKGARYSRWTVMGITSLIGFVMGFDYLIVLHRVGEGWAGFTWSSQWCVGTLMVLPAILGGILGGFATIPMQHAAAESCLPGKETFTFAVMMAVHNASGGLSELWGAGMARLFGVNEHSYGNLGALMATCNCVGLLFCLSIPLMPLHTRAETQRGYKKVDTVSDTEAHNLELASAGTS